MLWTKDLDILISFCFRKLQSCSWFDQSESWLRLGLGRFPTKKLAGYLPSLCEEFFDWLFKKILIPIIGIFCSYKRWPVVNINFKTKNQSNEMFHLMSEFQCWWNIHRGASYTWTWRSKDILRRGWGPTTASNVQKVEKKVWLWNLRGLHKVRTA